MRVAASPRSCWRAQAATRASGRSGPPDGTLEADLDDGVDASELVALLVAGGAAVNGVRAGTDLEDAFVALVSEDPKGEHSAPVGTAR